MFTVSLRIRSKKRFSILHEGMLEAASNSMKKSEISESKQDLIEKTAQFPDAPKELKDDVNAIHKYTREQLSAASDDNTKILALSDLDRDSTLETDTQTIINEDNLKK
jgi:hypothetical protein